MHQGASIEEKVLEIENPFLNSWMGLKCNLFTTLPFPHWQKGLLHTFTKEEHISQEATIHLNTSYSSLSIVHITSWFRPGEKRNHP